MTAAGTSTAGTTPAPALAPALVRALPASSDPDALFDAFTGWAESTGIALYDHQVEALLEVASGNNVIVKTPTGSGKSLIALGAHHAAMARGERSYYTAPVKALVSEKFFALCEALGADNVGMVTGDASINPRAPVVCATAEVVANLALREGPDAELGQLVVDEVHYYADSERGWAWQVPMLCLPQAQFVLLSATIGDTSFFEADLTRRTGRPTVTVSGAQRPVPLTYEWAMTPVHETLRQLLETHHAPVYVVHPTQALALERAQALMSEHVATREQKDAIAEALGGFRFPTAFGRVLSRLVRSGIGVHHAGMLPRYRRLVETLAQQALLQVVCGTDTLGVGINVPIRTVLMTNLVKFDGTRNRLLTAREFHQVAGRAGRAGFDTSGTVVVQAPEHVVENERALAKAGDDPKARRKVVRKKPPEGQVGYGEPTFRRLVEAEPETLTSSFRVSNAMLLNLAARRGDQLAAAKALLTDNHEPRARQRQHVRRAIALFRGLEAAGVLTRLPTPDADGRTVRVASADLALATGSAEEQHSDGLAPAAVRALNQPLSPFALAALELLDPAEPTYPLDVLSVVEATLDDPRPVLMAQQSRARTEAVAAMKAEGVEYEERAELVQEVTWPKPLGELLDAAFERYAGAHPWVRDFRLSPKGVAREMAETGMSFTEYVGHWQVTRSEGLVLRYLADAFRALRDTVPASARTEEVEDLTAWLGELVRQVDSSLLDEWAALAAGADELPVSGARPAVVPPEPARFSRSSRAFRVAVRNAAWRRVTLVALRRDDLLAQLEPSGGLTAVAWGQALEALYAAHAEVRTGADARGPGLLEVVEGPETWQVRQVLDDEAGDHDWVLEAEVDLAASDEAGEVVLRTLRLGEVGPAWAR